MAVLTFDKMIDLANATLPDLGRLKFSQIAQKLQNYQVLPRWLKKDKVIFDSGIGIQRTLMNQLSNTARHRSWFSENNTNIADHMKQINIPWRYIDDSWGFGYHEGLVNRGAAMIWNVMKPRRIGAMLNIAEELELRAWQAPPDESDEEMPYGVPYWVVKNAVDGFNGGAPAGFSNVGGLAPTTKNWQNYTFTYDSYGKAGMVLKMRRAFKRIKFKSPVKYPGYVPDASDNYRIYVNTETEEKFEDIGESQNENLGRDVASMDGQMVFRKVPIERVEQLDADTTNPIYMLNHDYFAPCVLKGDYLREDPMTRHPLMRNVSQAFVSLSYNYLCMNRRAQAVGYYSAG